MTPYQKLVRNKIPEILDQKQIPYEKRIASPDEFKTELIKKLQEEAQEFADDKTAEELADVLEVVRTLQELPEYRTTEEVRLRKRAERGGFDEKIILKGEK